MAFLIITTVKWIFYYDCPRALSWVPLVFKWLKPITVHAVYISWGWSFNLVMPYIHRKNEFHTCLKLEKLGNVLTPPQIQYLEYFCQFMSCLNLSFEELWYILWAHGSEIPILYIMFLAISLFGPLCWGKCPV